MSLSTIRSILIADSELSAIIGAKVYTGYAPQEITTAFLLLEEIYLSPNDCKQSASVMDSYGFMVSAVAPQYKTVEDLLKRVRKVLDMYSDGVFRGISYDGLAEKYDGTQDYFVKTYSFKSLIKVAI